jgi:hypothetical protein
VAAIVTIIIVNKQLIIADIFLEVQEPWRFTYKGFSRVVTPSAPSLKPLLIMAMAANLPATERTFYSSPCLLQSSLHQFRRQPAHSPPGATPTMYALMVVLPTR